MARAKRPPPGPTLFDVAARNDPALRQSMPLAERVRPLTLDDMVGHRDLIAEGKPLAQAITADRLPSMILWGPPGSGKTTLARVVAESTAAVFVPFSAVLGGVADIRRIVAEASERRRGGGGSTVLFVDEIHRFNKAQQDAFLPHVEDGTVTLIGATTENPSFSVNAPLLSRCVVYRLEPLESDDLCALLRRALEHPHAFDAPVSIADDALEAIASVARGDARRALGVLDGAVEHVRRAGGSDVDREVIAALSGDETLLYDKSGEEHYNVVSAFIKSMRGSDPDAAIYWMMRMLDAGEDPLYVLRRMLIFAGEDIGNADPRALQVAVAADAAFQRLGLPEGLYAMAQAAIYLACAPKSNASTIAWQKARKLIRERGALPVPKKLRNAPTKLMKDMGYGKGYRHAHNETDAYATGETYLPDDIVGTRFYEPTTRGLEARIGEWLRKQRQRD
jgi:putative ATPase